MADRTHRHVEHSVSEDSSVHVEPCFKGLFARVEHRRQLTARRDSTPTVAQTLEIKPFSASIVTRKCLRSIRGVLFFAPILIGARVRPQSQTFEEYGKMAKKGGAPTKSEVLTQISKDTGLSRKQVSGVFDSLSGAIKKSLRSNGLFTVPGLMKLKVVKKPATKAREGVNPFTGEKMTFKAKPASKKVRVLPLKNLKAMVN
jgi:nucleoid DNA-binding protein